jgi:hypothetical protein
MEDGFGVQIEASCGRRCLIFLNIDVILNGHLENCEAGAFRLHFHGSPRVWNLKEDFINKFFLTH